MENLKKYEVFSAGSRKGFVYETTILKACKKYIKENNLDSEMKIDKYSNECAIIGYPWTVTNGYLVQES